MAQGKIYTEKEMQEALAKRENQMKERFARIVPDQAIDYENKMIENETTIRDNSNMDATLKAIGKHTSNANDKVVWLFTNFHTDFLTVDNFIDHMNKPTRNWFLIFGGVFAIVSLTLIGTNFQAFSLWYGQGYDWAIFWGSIVGALFAFRFYRNRQKKGVQTGSI